MKYVRIGNDIGIKWNIFRNCQFEDLQNKNVRVYLFDKNGKRQVFNYELFDGYIQGTFYGRDQVTTGNYRLVLTENEGNKEMVTLDYVDAFVLSTKLKNMTQFGDDASIGIMTDVVELSSTISTDKQFVDLSDYVKREELDAYAPVEHTHYEYALKTELPDTSKFATKDELFSKDYNDLSNKPTIPEEYDDTQVRNLIDNKQDKLTTQQIANLNADHSKYLTQHQTLPDYSSTYAPLEHTHNQYALASDLASYAPVNHTHSQYLESESDPTVPAYVKSIKQTDIDAWNAATGGIDLSSYVTKADLDAASYITADQVTYPDYSNTYANINHTHDQYAKAVDLQSYALKTELPDTSNFATKDELPSEYDDTAVRNIIDTKQDKLSEQQIANLNADHSKYLTQHQTLPDYSTTYAPLEHTHSQYLTQHQKLPDYSNTYAPLVHSHNQYALASDLTSYALKTELFSKDYNDLLNKPVIPSEYDDTAVRNLIDAKQDKLSEQQIANLNADHSKYLTQHQTLPDYSTTYAPLEHTHSQYLESESDPTVPAYVKSIKQSDIDAWNAATGGVDLSNYVTKNELDEASYITADQVTYPDYSNTYAGISHTHDQYLTEHQDLSAYALKTELFSKDYNDLTNKPTIPSEYNDTEVRNLIAGKQDKLSEQQIANLNADHSKYLTEHQTLPDYSTTYAPFEHTHDQYAKATDLQSYVTKNELDAASYITADQVTHPDYSNTYANINHTHDQYLTEHQDLSNYVTKTDLDTSSYLTSESDPTVPAYVKSITEADITNWNTKYDDTNVLSRLDSIEATLGDAYTISENILNA